MALIYALAYIVLVFGIVLLICGAVATAIFGTDSHLSRIYSTIFWAVVVSALIVAVLPAPAG